VSRSPNKKNRGNLQKRKSKINKRLSLNRGIISNEAILKDVNGHYEISAKENGISFGGIGAIHKMVKKLGLDKTLNESLNLLKIKRPYHESDHILSLAYNAMTGGRCLQGLERLRSDEGFLNSIGAEKMPDPTTAGDFTRRFNEKDILTLMEAINACREKVWQSKGSNYLGDEAIIEVDGTIAGTTGECKGGMDMSYKGIWGYSPLLVTLASTREVLYMVNRPGNKTSHDGAATWIDRAIKLVKPHCKRVFLRGDTAFSLSENFERWSVDADFIFGVNNNSALHKKVNQIKDEDWEPLERRWKDKAHTKSRKKPENVKDKIVKERGYLSLHLENETIADFDYRTKNCKNTYRVVVAKKSISRSKGEDLLIPEVRYFFYITNRRDLTKQEVVRRANERCEQENIIEQVKNGVNAMRMPVDNLLSNWAYMVIATLAWNLKAWFAMMMTNKKETQRFLRMEFRQFLQEVICFPCKVIQTARSTRFVIIAYRKYLGQFLDAWESIRYLKT